MNHRDVANALNIISGFPNAREWTDEEKIQRGFSPNDICGPCGEFKIAPTEQHGNGEHILTTALCCSVEDSHISETETSA